MALRVVTMAELRFEVVLEPEGTGARVAEVCRRQKIQGLGISPLRSGDHYAPLVAEAATSLGSTNGRAHLPA